jgi:DNA replication protein DnaC
MIEAPISKKPSQRGFDTYDEALWLCPKCGPIEPHYSKLTGHWLRMTECACQVQERQQAEEAERRAAWIRKEQQSCYNWLGPFISDDLPLVEQTLDSFKHPLKWQEKAYNAARLFALQPNGILLLHGPYGTGKTHLLAAICNELRARHMSSRFCVLGKLHQAVAECHKSNEDPYRLRYQAIIADLLVIDDIGAATLTEPRLETINTIIDERTKHRRPIAISTNYLDRLEEFVGGRAKSRLSMNQIAVEMDGDDYRMEM